MQMEQQHRRDRKTLLVWTGDTFTPGATVDAKGLVIAGTLDELTIQLKETLLTGTLTHTGSLTLDGSQSKVTLNAARTVKLS